MRANRLLSLSLATAMALALLPGCGNADTTPAISTDTGEDTVVVSADDTAFPVKEPVELNEVLYDGEGLKVTATGLRPYNYSVVLDLDITNTGESPVDLLLVRSSLNGWVWDAVLTNVSDGTYEEGADCTVQPGETISRALGFSNEFNLKPCDIKAFHTIGFVLEARSADEEGALVANTGYLEVTIPGTEDYVQAYDDSGQVVFEGDGIRIVNRGFTDDGFGGSYTLYIENDSDADILLTPDAISVNDTALTSDDFYSFAQVPAGEREVASPYLGQDVTADDKVSVSFKIQRMNLDLFDQGVGSWEDLEVIATTPAMELR